jgi:hypothetical protein
MFVGSEMYPRKHIFKLYACSTRAHAVYMMYVDIYIDNNHHVAGKDMCVGFLFQGF